MAKLITLKRHTKQSYFKALEDDNELKSEI